MDENIKDDVVVEPEVVTPAPMEELKPEEILEESPVEDVAPQEVI